MPEADKANDGRHDKALAESQADHHHRTMTELFGSNEEFLQCGNWSWNPDADVLVWSRGMYRLMQFDPDGEMPEITMNYYQRCMVDGGWEKMINALKQAQATLEQIIEYKHAVITNDKKEKIFLNRANIIYDSRGAIREVLGITRDVTETSQLMDHLNEYKKMVVEREDFLGHGSWEMDLSTQENFWWSDGMYRLFGYNPEDRSGIVLNSDLSRRHLTPQVFDQVMASLKEVVESDNYSYNVSFEITSHTGEAKLLESAGKVIRDGTGKATRILGTTRDVTQLRKYERELGEKILELDRLSGELEDSAYAASHDLQEPLRKISTLSDRLQSKFNEVLPEDGRKYIERIQLATKNARLLVDSLLEFSRITHNAQVFKRTDLNSILNEVKSDLELTIEETPAVIEFDNLPVLEVSPMQIKQLFSNIILNSIKFKKENEPPVIKVQSKKLERRELEERHLDPGVSYFLISIGDNGIGFEDGFSSKIFQMFSRLNGKSEYPGAGIGLALCKKITENHKGRIFATSIPDRGAVFSIILPEKQG